MLVSFGCLCGLLFLGCWVAVDVGVVDCVLALGVNSVVAVVCIGVYVLICYLILLGWWLVSVLTCVVGLHFLGGLSA